MKQALVITSINGPTDIIGSLAKIAETMKTELIVIGDRKSPAVFEMNGVDFYSIARQNELGLKFVEKCHMNSYTRKNIGYLVAWKNGAEVIVETDDDNIPKDNYVSFLDKVLEIDVTTNSGWINAYTHFTKKPIWPRGFPLELVQESFTEKIQTKKKTVICPVQQGLADADPDVDAVYRLVFPLPLDFDSNTSIALGKDAWCPFNSQNTAWWKCAFPLLYLPSYCSFRMTDIWRSFVAQRICWEYGWHILFKEATMCQDRNVHNYLKDFADEVVGYLKNDQISKILSALPLSNKIEDIWDNLFASYEALVNEGIFDKEELTLLSLWKEDALSFK